MPPAGPSFAHWYTPEQLKYYNNVRMPGYREVKIHYDQPEGEGSATPVNVRVERRTKYNGKRNFYFPEILGEVSEDTTLDVFTPEPLPNEHPFWTHPRVTVTPHNASLTQPETAVKVVFEGIRRMERGELPENIVDRSLGY